MPKMTKGAGKSGTRGDTTDIAAAMGNQAMLGSLKGNPSTVQLPDGVKSKMSSAFNMDLNRVQFKEQAGLEKLGTQAVASGNQVMFAPGQFRPNTQQGQTLIGHELSHIASDRKSTCLNSSHIHNSRMPSSACQIILT